MCFSAPVSFILGATLIGSGAYSVKQVKNRAYLPLAMMPIFFGIQQILEGGVWLALAAHNQVLTKIFALGFLFFAGFFWPFWIPFSAYQLEPLGWRKMVTKWFILVAIVLSSVGYLLLLINYQTLRPTVMCHSIYYENFMSTLDSSVYLGLYIVYGIVTLFPFIISSLASLRFFAVLMSISLAITFLFYSYAYASVWCFFAAVLSFYIIWIVRVSSGKKR